MSRAAIERAIWQEIALYHRPEWQCVNTSRGRDAIGYLARTLADQDVDFGETGITAAVLGLIAGISGPAGARG